MLMNVKQKTLQEYIQEGSLDLFFEEELSEWTKQRLNYLEKGQFTPQIADEYLKIHSKYRDFWLDSRIQEYLVIRSQINAQDAAALKAIGIELSDVEKNI